MSSDRAELVARLAAKLESLDLTDDEQAALHEILDRAAMDDVEGYGVVYEIEVKDHGEYSQPVSPGAGQTGARVRYRPEDDPHPTAADLTGSSRR